MGLGSIQSNVPNKHVLGLDKASFSHVDLVNVTLRVHENIKDTISNRFGENCLTPDGDRFYIAHVLMPIDQLACSYLLSLADNCVCIEPDSLKSRVRQLSEQIYSQYHSTHFSY
ncbi:WYL domain-containing protein [Clostridium sp.]|uniref:WYL domain-containing protein n=1 Tax=Clostridium sp. TaxID=1506 RepID=UPI0039778E18